MNRKTRFLYIPLLVLTIVIWFYSLVLSNFSNILENTKVVFKNNPNIYLDSKDLNTSFVVFTSDVNLSWYKLFSECTDKTKFVKKEKNMFVFKIEDFSLDCNNPNVYLKSKFGRIYKNTKINFNLIDRTRLLREYLDYSTNQLEEYKKDNKYKQTKLSVNKDRFILAWYIEKLYITRPWFEKLELIYKNNIIDQILKARKNKYILPVIWAKLPKRPDKVPNFWRWYRAHYTDGIHHGWDIDSPLWTPLVTIDDGIIVRNLKDWKWENFAGIKYWKNLTKTDKARNLDILRWNQIWLKTMKWEVVFYSHLTDIPENIKKGDFIRKGTYIWKIGITWVPDKTYNDYHIHFPIQVNPYIISKAWKNVYLDYMLWDWKTKGKTPEYVMQNQAQFFTEENTQYKNNILDK